VRHLLFGSILCLPLSTAAAADDAGDDGGDPVAPFPAVSGAVLRLAEVVDADAEHLAISPDGARVLVYGPERATLLAPDGSAQVTVEVERLGHGAVANDGTFVLAHGGGVTVHGADGRREQLRMSAPPGVSGVAISADGARIAVASADAVTVNDAVSGRPRFSVNTPTSAASFDPDGYLWAVHEPSPEGAPPQASREGAPPQAGATRYDSRGRAKGEGEPPVPPGLLADGCLGDPEAGGLCVTSGSGSESESESEPSSPAWHGDGQLWALGAEGEVAVWRLLQPGQIASEAATTEITAVAPGGPGDVLVATGDGTLERQGPGGATVSVSLPGCTPCVPSLGGSEQDLWALAAGTFQMWDASGQPLLKRPLATELVAAGRLADGRWVGLEPDGRIRIGAKLGKGKPRLAVAEPVGLHAAGDTVAVWSASELQVLDGEGLLRSTPAIGADRLPVAVRVSPDGARVAVIDDAGALHLYEATGRAVFRLQAELTGTALAFDPTGALVVAGGAPLRAFGTADGAEKVRVRLPGSGEVSGAVVRGDGGLVLVQEGAAGQSLRVVDPAVLSPPAPAVEAEVPEEMSAGG
jgi:hypothetical protein